MVTGTGNRELRSQVRVCLGTAQWGGPYGIANSSGPPSDRELDELLAVASQAGVTHLDSARGYGESEERIGAAAQPSGSWFVTTKLAADICGDELSVDQALARVELSLEASRRALGRQRIDRLLLHRASHRYAYSGRLWERLLAERRRGGIGELGVSCKSPDEACSLVGDPEVESLQVAANLLDQRLSRSNFFERARARGLHVQIRSVFLQGVAFLEPRSLPAELAACAEPLASIRRFAATHGKSPAYCFLAHAMDLAQRAGDGTELVLGCERTSQLSELLDVLADCSASRHEERCAVRELAARLPSLPDSALDPWRWPQRSATPPAYSRVAQLAGHPGGMHAEQRTERRIRRGRALSA